VNYPSKKVISARSRRDLSGESRNSEKNQAGRVRKRPLAPKSTHNTCGSGVADTPVDTAGTIRPDKGENHVEIVLAHQTLR